jgi:hypothetical protein
MSGELNARHNHHIKAVNTSMENVTHIVYVDITLTNKTTYMKTLKAEDIQEAW